MTLLNCLFIDIYQLETLILVFFVFFWPSVLRLLNISAWLCTFSGGWRGETNHATCLNRTFLNQNNRLVVYHFTVLRQFEHSHFSPPTVTACIIKRWWNHLSGFDGSCLVPGGRGFFFFLSHRLRWGEGCVCSLDAKGPQHLILRTKLSKLLFADTGFPPLHDS